MNKYKEWIGEIPLNTLNSWTDSLSKTVVWRPEGWSGDPKEPYRHWTSFPENSGVILDIWKCLDYSFVLEGLNLRVDRVIANYYNHGDSSWLHKDSEDTNAYTAIVYMNTYWDINWGGETVLVEDNEILKSFSPTPGKFILFKSNILHGPRPVSREAEFSRLGLTFQCTNTPMI